MEILWQHMSLQLGSLCFLLSESLNHLSVRGHSKFFGCRIILCYRTLLKCVVLCAVFVLMEILGICDLSVLLEIFVLDFSEV